MEYNQDLVVGMSLLIFWIMGFAMGRVTKVKQ